MSAVLWLDHVARDLRHAVRALRRMPLQAAVIVISLAFGIGANVVVFSWLQLVVLQPLPGVADARAFHFLEPRAETGSFPGASWLEYRDLRERLRTMRDLVAYRMAPLTAGVAPETERIYAQIVSDNFFPVLGLRPATGRFFRPDEMRTGSAEPVVVISYGMWQARFSGAEDVTRRTLRLNDRDLAIVGVAPRGFQGTVLGVEFAAWVPASLAPVLFKGSRELDDRAVRGYSLMGRLAGGASLRVAEDEVAVAMRELAASYPASNATMTAEVLPFWRAGRGPQRMLVGALAALQGIMLLLLVAVCGNTANLTLARASARRREIGVRLALGAGRARIVSAMLGESLLLAVAGAGLGAALAAWGTTALRAVPVITMFPIRFQTKVDATGLLVALALALVCGVAFGLAPAAQVSAVDVQRTLRGGSDGSRPMRLRRWLIAGEVALALIVLLVAGLFYRGMSETRDIDPGFRRDGVLLGAYDLTGRGLDGDAMREFAARLLDGVRALPGVEAAAIASSVPLDIHGLPLRSFALEGRARPDGQLDQALTNTVTPGYFGTMAIPILRGRDFAPLRDRSRPAEAIVNEEFVRRFMPDGEPVGRRLQRGERSYVIAAVVRNSLSESFDEAPMPVVYYSYRDRPGEAGELHLRTQPGAETAIAAAARQALRDIDPSLPLHDVRTLAEHVEKNLFLRRIPARMFVVLGPLLLALAAIGIYAVVAYGVAQRTAEIGVRLALGATRERVVSEIAGETWRIAAAGSVAGWLAVYLVVIHVMPGRPLDPGVFAGIPALLLAVAAVACWLPARRAASVDPMVALRRE